MGKERQINKHRSSRDVMQKQIKYIREKDIARDKITALDRLIFAGLMAISLLFVNTLIRESTLDKLLTIGLFCFIFSIPGLAMSIFEVNCLKFVYQARIKGSFSLLLEDHASQNSANGVDYKRKYNSGIKKG
jgi:uncharacterized membrane protein